MRWSGLLYGALVMSLTACGGGGGGARLESAQPVGSGTYVTSQYTSASIAVTRNLVYSVRPNAGNQYTSNRSKDVDEASSQLSLALDVWVPPNTSLSAQPLIIYIHGGGFSSGDKADFDADVLSYAQAGYVAASINYRLTANNQATPEARVAAINDASEDLMNAVRYLKLNAGRFGIDPDRIATIGSSAGGGMSLINAVQYDTLAGAVSDYPGVSARTNAAVSTGATLTNTEGFDSSSFLTYTGNTPVMLFHANPTDGYTGATWTGDVLPTQALIQASGGGDTCTVVAQPDLSHTEDLSVGGAYWGTLQPFLFTQLRL